MAQVKDSEPGYISLTQAAKSTDYTQEYLSLRARQGKLKAKKISGAWVTTEQWLQEYMECSLKYQISNLIDRYRQEFVIRVAVEAPDCLGVGEAHSFRASAKKKVCVCRRLQLALCGIVFSLPNLHGMFI